MDQIREIEVEQERVQDELTSLLLSISKLPDDRTPEGDSDEFATDPPRWHPLSPSPRGTRSTSERQREFSTSPGPPNCPDHVSQSLAAPGAALERALGTLFLDLHPRRHGYVEHLVPYLVSRKTMIGTGQLQKFEADLFKTGVADRDLFLIPTTEVPLTNLYADEIIRPPNCRSR